MKTTLTTLSVLLAMVLSGLSQVTSTFTLRGEYDMHSNAPSITIRYPSGGTLNLGTNWTQKRSVTNGEIWSVSYPSNDIQTNSTFGAQAPVILNGTYTTINGAETNSVNLWIKLPVGYCGAAYVFYLDPGVENSLSYQCFHRTAATQLPQPLSSLSVWGNIGSTYGFSGTTDLGEPYFSGIAVGSDFALVLRTNGTVTAYPLTMKAQDYGQLNLPASLSNNVVQVACGNTHALALLNNGNVVGWGDNGSGQASVPTSVNGVSTIACGSSHSLAIRTNGLVIGWGSNLYGESGRQGLSNIVQLAAGNSFSAALKSNGTVDVWGNNTYGVVNVPSGLSNVVRITAGSWHLAALKSDGTVTIWGGNRTSPSVTNVVYTSSSAVGDWLVTGDGAVTMVGSDNVVTAPSVSNVVMLASRSSSHALLSGPVILTMLSRFGTNANLTWPAAVGGSIYSAPSIGSTWTALTNTVKYEGESKHVHITASESNRFFRLTTNRPSLALGLGPDPLAASTASGGPSTTNRPPNPEDMSMQVSEMVETADPIGQFYELVLWIEAMRAARGR